MKIAVIGAGATGSLFAWFFHRAGEEVWLLDIHPDRAEIIRRQGISLEGISGEQRFSPRVALDPREIGPVDLVLIAVKSYHTESAVESAARLLSREAFVLTLQNGIGNLEKIAAAVGKNRTLGGSTAQGSTLLGPGRIRHAGKGDTIIGEISGPPTERVEKIVAALRQGGAEAKSTANLAGVIWGKLLINAGINPLTALTRLKNGELLNYPGTRAVMQAAVQEGEKIARVKNIQLPYEDAVTRTEAVCRATAGNISSMLQDVLKKKRTEVANINGALVREGEALGIPAPVNQTLNGLVQTLEESYAQQVQTL
ncbi:MAG: 2-dehydropantoate 2-reductase [bacterium]|nr:2-dehydropantoate 2-reductase [bacterium]